MTMAFAMSTKNPETSGTIMNARCRLAVLFGNGCHVSHCGGSRAERNAGEARADDGRFVVAAHKTKDDKQCEDHSEDRLRGEDRENGSGDTRMGPATSTMVHSCKLIRDIAKNTPSETSDTSASDRVAAGHGVLKIWGTVFVRIIACLQKAAECKTHVEPEERAKRCSTRSPLSSRHR
jgi:hypothetical protein